MSTTGTGQQRDQDSGFWSHQSEGFKHIVVAALFSAWMLAATVFVFLPHDRAADSCETPQSADSSKTIGSAEASVLPLQH